MAPIDANQCSIAMMQGMITTNGCDACLDSMNENDLFFGVLDVMCQRYEYLQQTVREDLAM